MQPILKRYKGENRPKRIACGRKILYWNSSTEAVKLAMIEKTTEGMLKALEYIHHRSRELVRHNGTIVQFSPYEAYTQGVEKLSIVTPRSSL